MYKNSIVHTNTTYILIRWPFTKLIVKRLMLICIRAFAFIHKFNWNKVEKYTFHARENPRIKKQQFLRSSEIQSDQISKIELDPKKKRVDRSESTGKESKITWKLYALPEVMDHMLMEARTRIFKITYKVHTYRS